MELCTRVDGLSPTDKINPKPPWLTWSMNRTRQNGVNTLSIVQLVEANQYYPVVPCPWTWNPISHHMHVSPRLQLRKNDTVSRLAVSWL